MEVEVVVKISPEIFRPLLRGSTIQASDLEHRVVCNKLLFYYGISADGKTYFFNRINLSFTSLQR